MTLQPTQMMGLVYHLFMDVKTRRLVIIILRQILEMTVSMHKNIMIVMMFV